jgi:hypothetical protein
VSRYDYVVMGPPFRHLWEEGMLYEFNVRICTTKALYEEILAELVSAADPRKQRVHSMWIVSTKDPETDKEVPYKEVV